MGCTIDIGIKKQQFTRKNTRTQRLATIDARKQSMKVLDVITQNVQIQQKQLSHSQLSFAVSCFSKLDFFNSLSNEEINILAKLLVPAEIKQGQYVFDQGDVGNCFFLIQKGEVQVEIDRKKIKTLSQGQVFGELALILRTTRTAGIKAKKNCKFLLMKPLNFKSTLQKLKTKEYEVKRNSIQFVEIFQGLTNKQKMSLSNALKKIVYQKGDKIVSKDEQANAFYIIHEGKVAIQLADGSLSYLGKNQYFGESAFKIKGRRKCSVFAVQQTVCSIISKQDFEKHSQTKAESVYFYSMKKWALQRSNVFKNYNKNTLNAINFAFETIEAKKGTKLRNDGLVICLHGKINYLKQGECVFGQDSYNQTQPQYPQLIQEEDGFYAYLNIKKLNEVLQKIKQKKATKFLLQSVIGSNKQNKGFIDFTSFEYLKKLGEGQFGQVKLVRDPNFNRLYALKQISKSLIKKQGMQRYIEEERKILYKIEFPFIAGFAKAFSDVNNVYFLMEYIKGEELFSVIRQINILNLTIARYFFACILSSIQHLHSKNIIYRDIKPENSVVDYKGKVYLIDMGTAKFLTKEKSFKTFTVIGTPHYMAPEVFMNQGYSFQTDIWSLGVLLYELLCNTLPFGESEDDTFKVMTLIKKQKLSFPKNLQPAAEQLLRAMLNKNPKQRSLTATFKKIKQSQFFKGFNWQNLLTEKMVHPYIPKVFRQMKGRQTLKMQGKPLMKHLYPKAYEMGHYIELKSWDTEISF